MKEIKFKAANDYEINLYIWDEVKNARGVIQLVHGMAEHLGRYDDFAKFLNSHGFIVIGDDHRAHGKTAQGRLGVVPKGGDNFKNTVQDLVMITRYAKQTYNLPVAIFGHSYGSFLTQSYIEKASGEVIAAVLCGTACQNTFQAKFGAFVSKFGKNDKPAKLIEKLSFGLYDKAFANEKRKNAWLSRDVAQVEKYQADEMCGQIMSYGFYQSFFEGLKDIYKARALSEIRKDLPIFIISGDKDPVGENGKLVHRLYMLYNETAIKKVEMKLYAEGRHEILNEINKNEVYNDVLNFFNQVF